MTNQEIVIVDDPEAVSLAAAEEFLHQATEAVSQKGAFTVALSGGSTPRGLYLLLGSEADPFRGRTPWDKIHFFWGDERYVPQDHSDSNYRMACEVLLSKVPILPGNVHPVDTGITGAEVAAEDYEKFLRQFFKLSGGELPRFDLILLGMGQDGHTASIFPGTDAIKENKRFVVSVSDENLKITRITLTPPVINNALNIIFLVTGREKSPVLKEVLEGDFRPEQFPAQMTRHSKGKVKWLVDTEAAARLSR